MKRYCLALDLKDDPELIAEYRRYHQPGNVPREVIEQARSHGILREEIYLLGTRMVMVIETEDRFSFAAKAASDQASSEIQAWEKLMWRFQKALPQARPGEKWMLMEKISDLNFQ